MGLQKQKLAKYGGILFFRLRTGEAEADGCVSLRPA